MGSEVNSSRTIWSIQNLDEWVLPGDAIDWLSDDERSRLSGFSRQARQREYLGARTLARLCLNHLIPNSLASWRFSAEGPVVVDYSEALWVSLSHSQNWVCAGVSTVGRVGVDIECPKPNSNWQGIAERYFPEVELQWLNRLEEEARFAAFYELWTTKEAYLKAHGLNFHDGYRLLEQSAPGVTPVLVDGGIEPKGWVFRRGWHGDVAYCLCAENSPEIEFLN